MTAPFEQAAANREVALSLAAMGIAVIPCSPNKRPLITDWSNNASTDTVTIHTGWDTWPFAIPGIPCGVNGLLVVDCDRKNGKDGVTLFEALCAEKGIDLGRCPTIETPTGGRHYYFRQPTSDVLRNTAGTIGPGVDTRGEGGQVIAPGATLPDGRTYHFVSGTLSEVPEIPEALRRVIGEATKSRDAASSNVKPSRCFAADPSIERPYALSVLSSEAEAASAAAVGARNDTLYRAAFKIGTILPHGGITKEEAEAALAAAAIRTGLSEREIRRAIASGFEDGMANPRRSITERDADMKRGVVITGTDGPMPVPSQDANSARLSYPAAVKHLVARRVSDVQPEPIRWLWRDRIALGKLTIIAGDPGLGKSQLTAFLAACVSTGTAWPNEDGLAPHGSIIMLSCEDDVADTIRPRLEVAGADLTKVMVIEAVRIGTGGRRGVSLVEDLAELERVLAETGDVRLVVVDPITAYLDKTDTHKTGDVRAALAPLQDLAARYGVAIVAVSHLNKSGGNGKSINAVTGSGAFVAASRATFMVTKGQEDDGLRLFVQAKNNLANAPGLAFRVVERVLPGGIKAPLIEFERGTVAVTADEALGDGTKGQDRSALDAAKEFLRTELAQGPVSAKALFERGKDMAISQATLRRAKEALGVQARKAGYQGEWTWEMVVVAGDFPTVFAHVQASKMLNDVKDAHSDQPDAFGGGWASLVRDAGEK